MSGDGRLAGRAWPGGELVATLDRRFLAWSAAWTVASLVGLGLISAIIPNPVFGRQIPPEPFAIWVWLASAPLMGLVTATYTSPAAPSLLTGPAEPLGGPPELGGTAEGSRGSTLGTLAGIGVVFAIGCPICNKLVLIALGTSGALSAFAPIQPLLGLLSLALLAATLAWRLRRRARPAACPA